MSPTKQQPRWIIPVAALVAAIGLLFLYRDMQSEIAHHREVMRARGDTILDALSAGIRAQGRMGRYRSERLSSILDELAAAPGVIGLSLRSSAEGAIATGGDAAVLADVEAGEESWRPDQLVVSCEPLLLDHGPGGGMGYGGPFGRGYGAGRGSGGGDGQEDWQPFPPGPYVLAAALDTSGMARSVRGEYLRFAVSSVVTVLAVLLGALALLYRARHQGLQADLLLARERAAQQEHLTRLGAGLAHETKNPLGIVRGLAQFICRSEGQGDALDENRRNAEMIVDEIDRTIGHIDAFLNLARPKPAEPRPVPLDALLETLAPLAGMEAARKDVAVDLARNGLTVMADPDQLRRLLLNLMLNAVRACGAGDTISVAARRSGRRVEIAVADTGHGIAEDDLGRVTEPYFTRFEGGSGLGLAVVAQIVQAHGWRLHIASKQGKGTCVTVQDIAEGA